MINKINHFFLIIILSCSSTFVSSGNYEKIINFSKENYGSVISGTILGIFAVHTAYNKYKYPSFRLSDAVNDSIPLKIVCKKGSFTIALSLAPVVLGIARRLPILSNNSNIIWQFSKISASMCFIPLLIGTVLSSLDC
jgi:hypothetical protein